jgi:O-6-methylguanine DNA methyltransferase
MTDDTLEDLLRLHFRPDPARAALAARIAGAAGDGADALACFTAGLRVAATARGLTHVAPGRGDDADGVAARRVAAQARRELAGYLAGRRTFFSVPVDWAALPDFQRRVLRLAASIPFGEVRPYAWIAAQIGQPRAVRAVGTALGRNPVPLVVPCHRVLRSDGTRGGYRYGLAAKAALLALERTTPVLAGCAATRIVCRVGCTRAARMRPDSRIVFASVADAEDVGYRPCRICRPATAP